VPRDQIQEIKDKLDIVAVISSYIPLTKAGKNYKALCPFHAEKTPSFMVSPELQIFKCFGCGEGGDVISFYAKMEGVSFGEALREMARRAGVKLVRQKRTPEDERREVVYQINRLAADFFHHLLTEHRVGEAARSFLKKRGVGKDAIEAFDLGYAPNSWDSLGKFILSKKYTLSEYLTSGLGVRKKSGRGFYDFFRGRVVFPFRSSTGRVVGFSARTLGNEDPKYIHTPETPVFHKSSYLYNLDLAKTAIKRAKEAILVEGMMDVIALYERGIRNVVATMGTALTSKQVALLARFTSAIKLCLDKDTAGLEATKRAVALIQSAGLDVMAVVLPSGKDPDEAIRTDEKAFRKALEGAPPVLDFYLASALERFDASDIAGAKRVVGELLPVIKSLASDVERNAYLRKLADILYLPHGLDEKALLKQLEKEETLAVGRQTAPGVLGVSFRPKREAYFLASIISLPPKEVRRWLRKLSPEDFSDPALREIFVKLKAYLARVKRFRLANFSAKLEEAPRKALEELALLPDLREPSSEGDLRATLKLVRRSRYLREKRELAKAVKAAEAEGKLREVRRLQREVLKLSDKIRKLS